MTSNHRATPDPGGQPELSGSSAADTAKDVAQHSKQAAGDVAATAASAAKDVAGETASQARQLASKTSDQLTEQAKVQQQALVEGLRSMADQLGTMTDGADQGGMAVEFAAKARDRAREAGDWLDQREPSEVLDAVRDLGRRRPGAYLAGSLLAGVLAGRLTRGAVAVHTDDDAAESATPATTATTWQAGDPPAVDRRPAPGLIP